RDPGRQAGGTGESRGEVSASAPPAAAAADGWPGPGIQCGERDAPAAVSAAARTVPPSAQSPPEPRRPAEGAGQIDWQGPVALPAAEKNASIFRRAGSISMVGVFGCPGESGLAAAGPSPGDVASAAQDGQGHADSFIRRAG